MSFLDLIFPNRIKKIKLGSDEIDKLKEIEKSAYIAEAEKLLKERGAKKARDELK